MKHRCPICKKPTDSETDRSFPFCSERCSVHDLGAWASEKYVVSSPIFDEQEPERLDHTLRTQDEPNDTIH
jgi:endogenous inhibitor of DNA gyrase (YacG/DUF329 family)